MLSTCTAPKIGRKFDYVLSDQGVPRTFDGDCICVTIVCSVLGLHKEVHVFSFFVM